MLIGFDSFGTADYKFSSFSELPSLNRHLLKSGIMFKKVNSLIQDQPDTLHSNSEMEKPYKSLTM